MLTCSKDVLVFTCLCRPVQDAFSCTRGERSHSHGEIRLQITAELPHWSARHSSCASSSQAGSPPRVAGPPLVGTIKEIIKDVSHFFPADSH